MKTTNEPDPKAFSRFESLARRLVAVPKKDVAEQERAYKKARKLARKKRKD